ncbi:MAG: hypothetical protein FWG74_07495 [Planctomycetes bacterium]|nr:hypothetical protein [Planctomycetota bacterium]
MKNKILITYWIPEELVDFMADDFDPVYPQEKPSGFFNVNEIQKRIPEFEVVLLAEQAFKKETIDLGTKLKVIGRSGVGCDAVDCEYAGSKGIAVINAPTTVTQPTAELTIAIMMDVARCVTRMDKKIRQEKTCIKLPSYIQEATTLCGKTLGIIGFGRIGKAVGVKAKGLGMKVIYHDIAQIPKEAEAAADAKRVSREEVFRNADFVSLHIPYNPENHHLVNADVLALMQPSAYFVNAARGKVVEEASLIAALQNRKIKGAALDVYEFEPEISAALLEMDNVVLTPHMGTWTYDSRIEMVKEALIGTREYLKGEMPSNIFNLEHLKR